MPKFQSYNSRIGAYVMGHVAKMPSGAKYFKVTNVKQKEPEKPFKSVPIREKR